jgi:two-component system, cell cycle response regulator
MRQILNHLTARSFGAVLAALLGLYAALTILEVTRSGLGKTLDLPLYYGLLIAGTVYCLARPVLVRKDRLAWTFVGVGLACWTAGDLYYELLLVDDETIPYPSFSDALYIAFYPFAYVGLGLLLRGRTLAANRSLWLDGTLTVLTVTAVGAALAFGTVVDTTGGATLNVATNLAYPLGDLGLFVIVLTTLGLTGWHIDRVWACALAGCLVFAVADSVYLFQAAEDTYVEGTVLDAGWPAGLLLFAFAAWQPRRAVLHRRLEGFRVFVVPVGFGLLALGLLVYDHFNRLNTVALAFATLAVGAVIGRMAMTFYENVQLLERSRFEADTDALTGLANRRKLLADLESRIDAEVPTMMILFDLDGFKAYNDAFGHPAGDALLRRLSRKLAEATEPVGEAYRMGGDEFCLLATGDPAYLAGLVAMATKALEEEGEGFRITCAYGAIVLPEETTNVSEALRIADARMYGNKDSRRASAVRQSKDVLLSVLHERDAGLSGHLTGVARLARAVGTRLELSEADLHDLGLVAELHDVGKLAIPDAILNKPGPLAEDEWPFIHRHTLVGERILASAPSLSRVARLVRSTHERMDGLGYPDGLIGNDIPLISRIVASCDAYFAMTEERPYRRAMTPADALAELRRCAGSHFDLDVVEALVSVHFDASDPELEAPAAVDSSAQIREKGHLVARRGRW